MNTPLRLLVVEDSEDDLEFLLRELRRGGYDITYRRVDTAAAMRAALAEKVWDVVISDFSMPQFSGLAALDVLQQSGLDLPFIIVSGSIGEATAVAVMKAGAHDYLMKDNLARLVPAVERELSDAVMRREKRRAEEERAQLLVLEQKARAEAEAANRAKDEFLATLSHELRTPLTPILGWVRMMRQGMLNGEHAEQGLAVIDSNAQSLLRLINDLLDMTAILSGKMHIEQTPIDLTEVLTEAVETVRPQAEKRNINLEIELCDEIAARPLMVPGDRTRLVQVFLNLLSNAVKFSPENSRVRIACETDGDAAARVEVEDEGQGIAPEFLPHIFERFRQADGSNTRLYGGMGIGLALVKSFVEAHGGAVRGASVGHERGSKFTVELPLIIQTQEAVATSPAEEKAASSQPFADAPPVRLLIVEDSPDTLEMLGATFQLRGYHTTLCGSAREALAVATNEPFDVIISDIGLPETDGYELIKQLRAVPHLRHVLAVALTGYASQHDNELALAAGFNAHLAKPVNPALLLTQIEQQIRHARRQPPDAPDVE
ncbi:MAG: response regulator [Pyrinomonadaceae bacterium]